MKIEIKYGWDGIQGSPCQCYVTMNDENSGWRYGESGVGKSFEEARKMALSNLAQTIYRHERFNIMCPPKEIIDFDSFEMAEAMNYWREDGKKKGDK